MRLKYKNGEEVSDSIGLLISILVRYPEVSSTNYDPENSILTLSFTLTKINDENKINCFIEKFVTCLETLNFLEDREPSIIEIKHITYDKLIMLEIQRDVNTITHSEIALIISLLQEEFTHNIVADDNDSFMEEDLQMQEELIVNMLENLKESNLGKKLIAFREEGRVLVFNK
ncbi:hypothetical protein RDV78_00825 [Bacillota bacterium LX-D]|nr:hypothetical protein [Bacillota bacterium LX-D]